MQGKILHILSQRPSRTGSGITLDSMVRLAGKAGWQQAAMVGVPADDDQIQVGHLNRESIHAVYFSGTGVGHNTPDLDFAVPGMSDVMPYPSSIWSTLQPEQLKSYEKVWSRHIGKVVQDFQPDVIHSNHVWLVSSLLKDVAPEVPVVTTCHATGLRQLSLCPGLATKVISGCRRNDHFLVLRKDHKLQLAKTLNISQARISLAGVGFRDEIFHSNNIQDPMARRDLLYVGKFSRAKGLPWLLDAFEELSGRFPNLRLNVAGDGSGPQAERLRERMNSLAPRVIMHGMLDQNELAHLMRRCLVCVLPSFYEGVPLVLVEAAACGCRLVATALPGILEQIAPALEDSMELVPLPRLVKEDEPLEADLAQFTHDLVAALTVSLESPVRPTPRLDSFTWAAVFNRVESVWKDLTTA
jgi:glycosyltransferase involved in cell wall biosynthesis